MRGCGSSTRAAQETIPGASDVMRLDGRTLDLRLLVVLDADIGDQAELGFQPVDMSFFALENRLEQFAGRVVPHRLAVRDGFDELRAPLLRVLGTAGLLASLELCFAADRPSMAVLVWVMLLAAGATSVAMVLAWCPAWLRCFWPVRRIDPTAR